MNSARQMLGKMIKAPQYKISVKLMEINSAYNSYYKDENAEDQLINNVCHHFHFTHRKYIRILAGDANIRASVYYKILNYLHYLPKCQRVLSYYKIR